MSLHTSGRTILMTADPIGGVWTYAIELIRALEPLGVGVDLATMGRALSAGQSREAAALSNVEVHESRYRLEWMDTPWTDVAAAGDWLLELESLLKPDVIHLNGFAHGALPWSSPVLVVGHSCVCSWYEAVHGTAPPAQWQRYRGMVRAGLRSADLVTAPTRSMLEDLRRHYGDFRAAAPVYHSRGDVSYPERDAEPFVLAAGRLWDEAKNFAALEQVAGRIAWPVFVAGENETPAGERREFPELNRLGPLSRSELAERMARASIYVHPARYEPFGLTPVEAAMAGCALVLGDIPSLREVWGDAAVYVDPGDPDALAREIAHLIQCRQRRERYAIGAGLRARETVFSPRHQALSYLALYQKLVQNRHTAHAA